MEFKGILKEKFPMQQGEKNGKVWQSQQFRCETLEEHPQKVVFDLFGDKCDLIFNIPIGVAITVNYSFKANNSADGRWFNKINAWKVESEYKTTSQMQKTEAVNNTQPANEPPTEQNEENNDLPF